MGQSTDRRKAYLAFKVSWALICVALAATAARGDAMYSIQDLGTLSGTTSSVATSIQQRASGRGLVQQLRRDVRGPLPVQFQPTSLYAKWLRW